MEGALPFCVIINHTEAKNFLLIPLYIYANISVGSRGMQVLNFDSYLISNIVILFIFLWYMKSNNVGGFLVAFLDLSFFPLPSFYKISY